jgi:hypothetical protein
MHRLLLLYQLDEQIKETGFVAVADVVYVPQVCADGVACVIAAVSYMNATGRKGKVCSKAEVLINGLGREHI